MDAARAEDVTAAQLSASEWQAQAFRSVDFFVMPRFWVTERDATDAVRNGGDWRAMAAEYADEQLDLADRRTGASAEEGESPTDGSGAVRLA